MEYGIWHPELNDSMTGSRDKAAVKRMTLGMAVQVTPVGPLQDMAARPGWLT